MSEDEITTKLMEEHKDDFKSDETNIEPTSTGTDDKTDSDGGDNSENKPADEDKGTDDSSEDGDTESSDSEDAEEGKESEGGETGPAEPNDSDESGTEPVGEKKDANSRIRQLNEEKKAIQAEKEELAQKLAEKEEAERKIRDSIEDPVYTKEDFIGTLDENGEVLTDGEANARFRAWESDYKLRQFQKQQVLKEQQETLLKMQSETKEAFTKFPEFNKHSDDYDPQLADIANEAFRAGLIYADGHDGDDNYIIGSRVNPGQLLEKLHKLREKTTPVTKVNNLGDDSGKIVNSQQVNKKAPTYAPGFRGEVDAEIDKIIGGNK